VADLIAAAQFLAGTIGAPSLLIGHSLGGAAVLAAAGSIPSAQAVATIGAPADVAHVLHNIKGDLAAIAETGHGLVTIGGQEYPLAAPFLEAARNFDLLAAVARLRIPLLFAHAPRDEIVGIENAKSLFEAALHPKTILSLDDADHLLTKAEDVEYVTAMIASWADRYLPPAAGGQELQPGHVLADNKTGELAVYLQAGTHHLLADEPVAVGGHDAGPGPYDLLLSALGACTAMTIRIVAKRENIPLEDVSITLSHQRDHHKDCDHCDDGSGQIQAIHRAISLTGNLTDAERSRLMGVAAKCPIHRTITGTLHIHDRADAPAS
jgi:putative redox protein